MAGRIFPARPVKVVTAGARLPEGLVFFEPRAGQASIRETDSGVRELLKKDFEGASEQY
jgi:hypothetical protein